MNDIADLTDIQKQAVDWKDGAFLLLAGPGSGKTRVLTTRIARLLDESRDKSYRILSLTFTNRAADEMRERVENRVPELSERAFIGTFHSFCTDVLRQHGVEIGLRSDFKIYSLDEDRKEILEEATRRYDCVSILEGLVDYKKMKVLPLLDRIRDRLIEPENVSQYFRDESVGDSLSKIYKAYDQYLIDINAQDFCSLILNAYRLFSRYESISKRLRTVYKYWSVDEFQDTNSAQFKLLSLLAGSSFDNIFVVADDDQIIYQWNGASYKRLDQYINRFNPEVLQLPTNFRCPKEIVAIANKLVSKNHLRTSNKKPIESIILDPIAKNNEVITLINYETEQAEAIGIAQEIANIPESQRDDIVILGRTRKLLDNVHKNLQRKNVLSRIVQRRDDFQSFPFVWLHACLKLSNDRSDKRTLVKVIGSFNSYQKLDISVEDVISEACSTEGDLLRTWVRTIKESNLDLASLELIEMVSKCLVKSTNYRQFVEYFIAWTSQNDTPNTEDYASAYTEDFRAWTSLYTEIISSIGQASSLESFLQELELRSKEPPKIKGETMLSTIHGAKGNEFRIVYLMGLADDILPSFQSKMRGNNSPEMEEERRNCFVAITRAKVSLRLSYASEYNNFQKMPSRFLREMELI